VRLPWPVLLAAGVALALLTRPAEGQPAQDRSDERGLRLGAVRLRPGLQITNIGVDTNVFNEARDPKQDTTAVVVPSLAATVRTPRVQVRGTGQMQMVYFREYANQRSLNWAADARLDVPLGHVTPFVAASAVHTRERPTLEIDVRARRSVQTTSAGLAIQAAPRLTLLGSVREARTRFADTDDGTAQVLRETLTGASRDVTLGSRLALTPITTLVVNVQRQQDLFEFTPMRDADSTRVTAGIEGAPLSRFDGRVEIGVRRFDARASEVPDFHGLVASADVGYRLGGSQQLRLRATRDVAYSFSVTEPYFVVSGGDGTYVHRFSERFEALASLGRYRLAYRDVFVRGSERPPIAPDLVGRVDTAGAGVGLYLTRQVRFGVTAEVTRRVGGPRSSFRGLRLFSSLMLLP
jgi:hypothetical protein